MMVINEEKLESLRDTLCEYMQKRNNNEIDNYMCHGLHCNACILNNNDSLKVELRKLYLGNVLMRAEYLLEFYDAEES